MNARILFFCIALFVLAGCSSSGKKQDTPIQAVAPAKYRMAILPFTGGTGNEGTVAANLLANQKELQDAFLVSPWTSAIEELMKEQRFQRSGLADADAVYELGNDLTVDFILSGHIQKLRIGNLLLITLIHVERRQKVAGIGMEFGDIAEIRPFLPDMARKMVEAARADSSGLPGLAVLPFDYPPSGVNVQEVENLAQILSAEIADTGKYMVLPRLGTIETLMAEQNLKRSNLTDPENIKNIGAMTGARYVLAGNVISQGAKGNLLLARILNTDDGLLEAGGDLEYKTIADGYKLIPDLSYALTGIKAGAGKGENAVPDNLAYVEGGTFLMGSGNDDEKPAHKVTVQGFYLGKTEVTQKEYAAVMGNNPSNFRGDNLPVENVSWFEAVEYCNRLSLKENLVPAYSGGGDSIACDFSASGYRLPTEAEWEYAAKGGNKDAMIYEYSGGNSPDTTAWYRGNSGSKTHEAAGKAPNSLGLYDMSGNVGEWCWDWYAAYTSRTQTDPRGAAAGAERSVRGGAWDSDAPALRSASRNKGAPLQQYKTIGFRVLRSVQ
ncbi:MAG: SUMF1/EgtB/PvdO family nonheme iron enzyme [Treponema sp.]|jgi:formylglycine-generating enzyme required for sulfatase activity/TolB-like protein|nr:SUMF1/EgtB/PvdO family nonheme iron enzyme [Treponema sp.]